MKAVVIAPEPNTPLSNVPNALRTPDSSFECQNNIFHYQSKSQFLKIQKYGVKIKTNSWKKIYNSRSDDENSKQMMSRIL